MYLKVKTNNKWGFLRETTEGAKKAGIDKDTGLHRTGLEEYLKVIFPDIEPKDWIHDKPFKKMRIRPDYLCESKHIIIEFDGLQHYQKPDRIKTDEENEKIYQDAGYTVIRIPYFIQLTNDVVRQMFDVAVEEPLFDPNIPSMGVKEHNTPAYCCPAGLKRMAQEFHKYPQQYNVNLEALETANDDFISGASLLKKYMKKEL